MEVVAVDGDLLVGVSFSRHHELFLAAFTEYLWQRRNELDLALQQRMETSAPVGRGLEMLIGVCCKKVWVCVQNIVIEYGVSSDRFFVKGLQEFVAHA